MLNETRRFLFCYPAGGGSRELDLQLHAKSSITNGSKIAVTNAFRLSTDISPDVIEDKELDFHLYTSDGRYAESLISTLPVTIDTAGKYTMTFSAKCAFGYNPSSSGPYNSGYGIRIMQDDETTIFEYPLSWSFYLELGNGYFYVGAGISTHKWLDICTVTLDLQPGTYEYQLYISQQDIRNKNCETGVSGYKITFS